MMKTSTQANLWLVVVALFWGITFPVIKNAVSLVSPFVFVSVRFLLASLFLLPFILPFLKDSNRPTLKAGMILGVINSISYTLQTMGLEHINASRSAFIVGTYIVLVPFIGPLFKQSALSLVDIISGLICLGGLYILTGAEVSSISYGDVLTLLCALFVAIGVIYLHAMTNRHPNYHLLCFYQIVFSVPLPLMFSLDVSKYSVLVEPVVWVAILFCAIFATALTIFLQTKYQRHTTTAKAALIFSLEPVFASIFGWLLNNDPITKNIFFGGILMLIGILFSEFVRIFLSWKHTQHA